MPVISGGKIIEGAAANVWSGTAAPTSGTEGSFTGARQGDLYIDSTGGSVYVNEGTVAGSPTWGAT